MKSIRHKIKFFLKQRPWRKTRTEKLQEEKIKEGFSSSEVVDIIDEKVTELLLLSKKKGISDRVIVEIEAQIDILEWLKEEIQSGTS